MCLRMDYFLISIKSEPLHVKFSVNFVNSKPCRQKSYLVANEVTESEKCTGQPYTHVCEND